MVNRRRRSRRIGAQRIDLQNGVARLARSIKQVEVSLHCAEQKIEADARDRIRQLRVGAREQLLVLRAYEHEAMRILRRLSSSVANGSWADLERTADGALKIAGDIADSIIERCRRILSERHHDGETHGRGNRPDRRSLRRAQEGRSPLHQVARGRRGVRLSCRSTPPRTPQGGRLG
jgi:hypothetical protein